MDIFADGILKSGILSNRTIINHKQKCVKFVSNGYGDWFDIFQQRVPMCFTKEVSNLLILPQRIIDELVAESGTIALFIPDHELSNLVHDHSGTVKDNEYDKLADNVFTIAENASSGEKTDVWIGEHTINRSRSRSDFVIPGNITIRSAIWGRTVPGGASYYGPVVCGASGQGESFGTNYFYHVRFAYRQNDAFTRLEYFHEYGHSAVDCRVVFDLNTSVGSGDVAGISYCVEDIGDNKVKVRAWQNGIPLRVFEYDSNTVEAGEYYAVLIRASGDLSSGNLRIGGYGDWATRFLQIKTETTTTEKEAKFWKRFGIE